MKKTESRSIETIFKEKVFRIFDVYDLIRGKATRLQTMHMAVIVVVASIGFAFVYILYFSYIPSDENRSSLISLIVNSGDPSPPAVQRLLTREDDDTPRDDDWSVFETDSFEFSHPSRWFVEEEASPPAVLISSDKTAVAYLRIVKSDNESEQRQDICQNEENECSDVRVDQIAFEQILSRSPEKNIIIATMSAQQRDILYSIEYQHPEDDDRQAQILEEILESIRFR